MRPVITLSPDKTVSIGFTTPGPIFNLRVAINADKKDITVDFIGVQLIHEDGEQHNFEWAGMYELFSEIRGNRGESQTIHRDTSPITIKVSTLSPIINFFRFRETEFLESSTSVFDKFLEHATYLQKIHPQDHSDQLLQSKPADEYLSFMRKSFWWKAGTYTVRFEVRSPSRK